MFDLHSSGWKANFNEQALWLRAKEQRTCRCRSCLMWVVHAKIPIQFSPVAEALAMKWMNFLWHYASAKTVRSCHKKEHLPAKFSTCGGRDIPAKTCQDHPRAIIWITNHSRRTALQYRPSFCLDCWVTPFAGWRHWSILWTAHPPDQRNCRLKRLIKPIKAEWVHYSSSCVHYVALGLLWCRPRCGHFCM